MKIPARPLVLLSLLPFLLAGCLQIDTLVTVRADGSGTVRERVAFSGELAGMIREMAGGDADASGFDRDELEQRAAAMGPGVTLSSVEPLPAAEGMGYVAVWAFEDVDSLRVAQDAEGTVPGEDAAGGSDEVPAATFRLERGERPVLHVQSSLATADAEPPPAPSGADAADQVPPEMLREMFGGLRFSFAVEVEGGIVETDASHRDGSRVTLFALDFDRLLENQKALEVLAANDSPEPMAMQAALRGVPGLTVETAESVRIVFSPKAGAAAVASAEPEPAADAVPAVTGPAAAAAPAEAALPPSAPEAGTATARPAPMPAPAASLPGGSIGGYAWSSLPVSALPQRVGDLVAVLDADGVLTKGMVLGERDGRLQLRRASMDGGGTVTLPLDALRQASVFQREP